MATVATAASGSSVNAETSTVLPPKTKTLAFCPVSATTPLRAWSSVLVALAERATVVTAEEMP
jgi:hypothetical protein